MIVFVSVLAAITLLRFVGQHFAVVALYIEKAQYSVWSQHLALGHSSRPPRSRG
jgi:hypothetical protein